MKIDMLTRAGDFMACQEVKKEEGGVEFLKVFASELKELGKDEGLGLPVKDEEKMEDDLMAAMAAIINKIFSNDLSKGEPFEEGSEFLNSVQGLEFIDLEQIKELGNGKQIEDLLNQLNLDLETQQNLEGIDLKELMEKLLDKAHKDAINSSTLSEGQEEGLEINNLDKLSKEGLLKDSTRVEVITTSKVDKLFNLGTLKNRSIIVEEKPTNLQGEFNLLNRIAFSTENFTSGAKELAPVIVRNEFLSSDILQVVKYLSNNKVQELNVKITPKELGEVNIKLLKTEESNELVITLTNKKAFEMIKENVGDIERHLASLDIKVKEVVVQVKDQVYRDFSGSFSEQFNKNGQREERKGNFNNSGTLEEEESTQIKEESNLNLLV